MITLANIRRAVYYLNKRIDLLEKNGGTGGGGNSQDSQELRNRITALESIISEGENPTVAIDKFNEIVAFLNTINNTDTLSGLLLDIVSLIPSAQIQADWDLSDNTLLDFIKNKPTIPAELIQSDWNESDNTSKAYIANKPTIFSGSYNDLSNKPDVYTKSEADGKFVATHDYVEIGGIKWATMNVGANNITDAGLYFQWADVLGYTTSQMNSSNGKWNGYKYCSSGNSSNLDKYNSTDSKTKLDSSDDAVKAIWGSGWRMPTAEEYTILKDAVNTTWTNNYQGSGVRGRILTDKTDNSKTLFFPAVGEFYDGSLLGNKSRGRYWSTDLYTSDKRKAICFSFDGSGIAWGFDNWRCANQTIRAVYDESISYNDLKDKPTIPEALIQSDWNQSDSTAKDFIKNKPTIPAAQEVPSKLSNLLNDKNFLESPKYDYVEIGGIKWATMNIGANSETDKGLYFQWGDVEGYSSSLIGSGNDQKSFTWVDYKYGNGTSSPGANRMSKYNSTDGKTTLEDTDDASKVILKGSWRLPTQEEFLTLISSTNRSWKSNYNSTGVKGTLLTSKADSNVKLFFPIGGFALDNNINSSNSDGFYWSSTLSGGKNEGRSLCLNSGNFLMDGQQRNRGHFIRAVLDENSSNLLSKVALTGSYNDLSNKPTIPTVPSSEAAASGGSTLSLVTTGEKYNWNNKANIWRGTQAEYDLLTPDNNTIYIITATS